MRPSVVAVVEQVMLLAQCDDIDRINSKVRLIDDEVMAIVGFVELALLRAGNDDALVADLEEIRSAAIRAISKTKNLGSKAKAVEVHTPVLSLLR